MRPPSSRLHRRQHATVNFHNTPRFGVRAAFPTLQRVLLETVPAVGPPAFVTRMSTDLTLFASTFPDPRHLVDPGEIVGRRRRLRHSELRRIAEAAEPRLCSTPAITRFAPSRPAPPFRHREPKSPARAAGDEGNLSLDAEVHGYFFFSFFRWSRCRASLSQSCRGGLTTNITSSVFLECNALLAAR